MRTERLFYKDSHQTTCQAKVLACREVKKGYEILLDQTVFYPEGGGQPCDIGTMNRVEVMDVQEKDGEIWHRTREAIQEGTDTYGIGTRAYVAVLDILNVVKHASFDRKYEGIAKFPAVNRDISMVVPKEIMVGQIEHMIAQRGGKILEHFELFDIYEGDQIERGFKSVAYSLTFRSKEKTLEEAEINGAMNKILNGLEGMGIQLRK